MMSRQQKNAVYRPTGRIARPSGRLLINNNQLKNNGPAGRVKSIIFGHSLPMQLILPLDVSLTCVLA